MAADTSETKITARRGRGRPRKAAPADAADKRTPDYEHLQTLLRDDILSGRLAAGSRLKVSEISARFRTSTNPAREALRGLEGEGLVVIQANRGASVREIDDVFVQNIFDIRRLIEPYIIRYFVEHASPIQHRVTEGQAFDGPDHGLHQRPGDEFGFRQSWPLGQGAGTPAITGGAQKLGKTQQRGTGFLIHATIKPRQVAFVAWWQRLRHHRAWVIQGVPRNSHGRTRAVPP